MEGAKERLGIILADEKNEIEGLRKIIREEGNLSSKIREIRNELGVIEDSLKSMDNKFKGRIKKIQELDDEITYLNFEVQCKDIDTIALVIMCNLPDGFYGSENTEENGEGSLKRIEIYYNLEDKTHLKRDKDVHVKAGKINILATEDKQFKIEVSLGDNREPNYKETEFIIPNLYRIYKIIVWINTNLYYHE